MSTANKEITNPDLSDQQQDEILKKLPGGMKFFETVHYRNENEIIKLAESLVKDLRKKLGSNTSKPRMKAVEDMFYSYAKKPRKVPKAVEDVIRKPAHVEKIAVLDQSYDQAVAKAVNAFDQTSVEAGSKVQEAYDNWTLAVRIYESACRSAGAVFKAKIVQAHEEADQVLKSALGLGAHDIRLSEESMYFTRSKAIGTGLVDFESSISKASGDLAKAFGALIADLFGAVSNTCEGEATLIAATQTASLTFWSGVESELAKSVHKN